MLFLLAKSLVAATKKEQGKTFFSKSPHPYFGFYHTKHIIQGFT